MSVQAAHQTYQGVQGKRGDASAARQTRDRAEVGPFWKRVLCAARREWLGSPSPIGGVILEDATVPHQDGVDNSWWCRLVRAVVEWVISEKNRVLLSDCGFHAVVHQQAGSRLLLLKQFLHIEWFVLGFCGWAACTIVEDWQDSALDRFSWLAFLLWMSPVFVEAVRRASRLEYRNAILLSWIGLGMALLGSFGFLPSFKYHGLAFAVAGLLPWSWRTVTWLFFSATWTPVFGLVCSDAGAATIAASRVIAALLAATLAMHPSCTSEPEDAEITPPAADQV